MDAKHQFNFERISKAIGYIETAFKSQPNLDEIAERVHLSPFHFQRLFKEWAGVSPKRFLQYISLEHAKNLLSDQNSIFDVAFQTGFSGTSRLHDLFVNIEGMTPAVYKNGGKNLVINYSFAESLFGNLIVASTSKGICHMAFEEDESAALQNLIYRFPNAVFKRKLDLIQQDALYVFRNDWSNLPKIKLHLHGTDFQLKVWESLLKIPSGKLSTYGRVAENIGHIGASRAVGTAIGSNPVAFLIPCHRVIQSTGSFGGYRWGTPRKTAIIGWESAREYKEI